jgi:hypothetical protein
MSQSSTEGYRAGSSCRPYGKTGRYLVMEIRLVNSYLARLQATAETDAKLATAFIRVVGVVDRPESLLRPDRVLRVPHGQRNWTTTMRHRSTVQA